MNTGKRVCQQVADLERKLGYKQSDMTKVLIRTTQDVEELNGNTTNIFTDPIVKHDGTKLNPDLINREPEFADGDEMQITIDHDGADVTVSSYTEEEWEEYFRSLARS